MKLYSSNETNTISTQNITRVGSLTTFFASKSEPITLLGDSYQNGTPSPNNPIEVQNVTGLQTIDVCSKNLLNRATCEENKVLIWNSGVVSTENKSVVSDYISTSSGKKYKFTYKAQVMFYDSSKTYLGCLQLDETSIAKATGTTVNTLTVPTNSSIAYMRLGFRTSSNGNADLTTKDIMVNTGETLLPYEPYTNNNYSINLNKAFGKRTNNLYNYKNTITVSSGITKGNDGWITATYTNSTSSPVELYYYTDNLDLDYNTEYAIFIETQNVNITNGGCFSGTLLLF